MNYEEFTEHVKQGVEVYVRDRLKDGFVVIRNVLKNNGVRMKAVSIVQRGERATPTIYLKDFYQEYRCGRTIDSICGEIFETYVESLKKFREKADMKHFFEFEEIRDKIYFKLIHYEWNESVLKEMPYFKFLDLAIVFYVMISSDRNETATVPVYHHNLETWNKTVEEIREIAVRNTLEKFPAEIRNMEDVVADMIIDELPALWDAEDSGYVSENIVYGNYNMKDVRQVIGEEVSRVKAEREMEMYVLTNTQHLNGAACITYPEVLKEFANKHQCDVYILPSSLHEVILIPNMDWDIGWLNRMVKRVNHEDLDAVDILSDHVYLYRRDTDKIEY